MTTMLACQHEFDAQQAPLSSLCVLTVTRSCPDFESWPGSFAEAIGLDFMIAPFTSSFAVTLPSIAIELIAIDPHTLERSELVSTVFFSNVCFAFGRDIILRYLRA